MEKNDQPVYEIVDGPAKIGDLDVHLKQLTDEEYRKRCQYLTNQLARYFVSSCFFWVDVGFPIKPLVVVRVMSRGIEIEVLGYTEIIEPSIRREFTYAWFNHAALEAAFALVTKSKLQESRDATPFKIDLSNPSSIKPTKTSLNKDDDSVIDLTGRS